MVKRTKRLLKAVESLKEEIEEHFKKLESDIKEKNRELTEYHIKEIDCSLINALEDKINLLGTDRENLNILKEYKARLEEFKRRVS